MNDILLKLQEAILGGDDELTKELTQKALDEGSKPEAIFAEVLAPALQKVGSLWKEGKFYMPDAVISIDSFQVAKELLLNSKGYDLDYTGKVVIGTVAGNEHVLGKKMIIGMLEAYGFEVINLGENVPTSAFIDSVREAKPDILALGCYTSSSIYSLRMIMKELEDNKLRDCVKVIIGGKSTSQKLADELGIDVWSGDVLATVKKAKQLMNLISDRTGRNVIK